jgi:glycosyltransferase involved in cell wall biosynthesis
MNEFVFLGFHMPRDGYGYATIKIADELARLSDEKVASIDMRNREGKFGLSTDRSWELFEPTLALCVPEWLEAISAPRLVSHTMFEATRLPAGWAEMINDNADLCLVPCEWCLEVFEDNGVTVPLQVLRWGVDPADYYPLDRSDHDGPYTFLWSGTPDKRKGWDLVYRAFWQAFQGSDDVRLILHFRRMPRGKIGFRDSNVEVIEGLFGRPELRQMLQRADCYLFPSRGEGWGLPPREAAATGLPVIATNWGGLAEEIEEWALPVDVIGMSKADYGFWDDIGEWAEPSLAHLIERMRWCYEHREEAAVFGAQAAAWIAQNATWERTARQILEVMA